MDHRLSRRRKVGCRDEEEGRFTSDFSNGSIGSSLPASSSSVATSTSDQSAIIARLQSTESKVALCAIGEYFLDQLCDICKHDEEDCLLWPLVNMCDIKRSIRADYEFYTILSFLGVDWAIECDIPE